MWFQVMRWLRREHCLGIARRDDLPSRSRFLCIMGDSQVYRIRRYIPTKEDGIMAVWVSKTSSSSSSYSLKRRGERLFPVWEEETGESHKRDEAGLVLWRETAHRWLTDHFGELPEDILVAIEAADQDALVDISFITSLSRVRHRLGLRG